MNDVPKNSADSTSPVILQQQKQFEEDQEFKARPFHESIPQKLVFSNMAICLIQIDYRFLGKFESITMK